ncbi:hypothetical protein F0562_032192 [Nyssa sinensis]|uniref:Retrotransposon gag domain-containing protein n=1 Tax=Nyssa sinensis TaxID=561372 RepID=A0A5J5AU65_9ASTE|nr:hypothetical protein F0562_032192 [Nyssa sinensis]
MVIITQDMIKQFHKLIEEINGPLKNTFESQMATNKERIEKLESEVLEFHEGIRHLEASTRAEAQENSTRLQRIDDTLKEITRKISSLRFQPEYSASAASPAGSSTRLAVDHQGAVGQYVAPRYSKMDIPHYSSTDPTEWLNRVTQFFKYQSTPEVQRVTLASFHLEGEANQWLQWLQ